MVTHIRVNGIGKIQRSSIPVQINKFAFGSEHEYLIWEKFRFRMVKKFQGISCMPLHIYQLHQPVTSPHLR